MKVYGVYCTDSDGCTYSCESLFKLFAKLDDAESELLTIELIQIEANGFLTRNATYEEFIDWQKKLETDMGDEYVQFTYNNPYNDVFIREIEVIE